MMFDAAAGAVMQNAVLSVDDASHAPVAPDGHDAAHGGSVVGFHDSRVAAPDDTSVARTVAPAATSAPHDVIFIDTSVDDYQKLAAEWAKLGDVVLIDGSKDGLDQVRSALAGESNVAAIHIVSHGEEGVLYLGTTRIDEATITGGLAQSLGAIGRSLNSGGDILLYGCDFAEGSDGARALAAFAQATHADVAASTDLTGYAGKGGDWVLEAHSGTIEARSLSSDDWTHTLDPNVPVPIAVTADSLTVTDGSGNVIATGATGYTTSNGTDRTGNVGAGAVARWSGAATLADGSKVDLVATVVSISNGDAVQFNRPTAATNGDDPTFLLRDLSNGNGTNGDGATVQIIWSLVKTGTNTPVQANVEFGILDIDGVGGNPNTRESVSVPTDNLAYYTTERATDIAINPSLSQVAASGTQNENTVAGRPLDTKSEVTFDWTKVSSFTINYSLAANNGVTVQAQFYQDGNADFKYSDPLYTSIPRLDLDANDSTATGNDAHFTYTTGGSDSPIVDSDVRVSNPMDINSVTGATVTLTNAQAGDVLNIGSLPTNITASATSNAGTISVALSGLGSESDYDAALRAITFANGSATPDGTQRVIDVSFTNGTLTSATAISRIDINHAPVANPDSRTTPEDTATTITVLANDTDADGDPLTVTGASALHGSVAINPDGTLSYTPNADYNGSDTISYAIADGRGGTSASTVAVTITPVNDAPRNVGTLPPRNSQDAATVSYPTAGGFTDIDGDTLTYSATGLPSGLAIDPASGVISGTIDRSASQAHGGSYAVAVTATDPSNTSATQTFTLTVSNPPPIAHDDSATTPEDTVVVISVLANDTDPDGDPLTVTGASASHGSVAINPDGTLTYTPNADYNGTDSITYAISDGQGGTSTAHVAVTITPVNDAPRNVGTLPPRSSQEAATVSYATAGGFTDVDGDTLTYTATGLPSGLAIDPATGVISGTIDRSVSQAHSGSYTVAVTATDPSNTSATQTFTLTVTNPPPVAHDDIASVHIDTARTIVVLANDVDPDGDPLTVTGASASHGSVVINPDGTLTYTPAGGYTGADTIAYAISDGQGGTSNAVVTIAVSNAAPTHTPLDPQVANDGQAVSLPVASHFTDPDGDPLTYAATNLPAGLSIDPATGVISGTINRSASQAHGGVYDTVVTATDSHGASDSATFRWTIANPPPVAHDDSATTPEDAAVIIPVLANDVDPDGDPLTVTAASALHGSVAINPDGTLTYTPSADYNGTDSITYAISDGQGGTSSAHVAVTITPVNDAPRTVGMLPPRSLQDAATVTYPIAGGFTDIDGDTLTYTATGLPSGLAIDPATGVISGTIDRSASQAHSGNYAVAVTATDPSNTSATQTFTLTVTNPPPVARNNTTIAPEDTAVVIPVLADDVDPDGDPLTVTGASALHGSVAINPNGTLTYTPNADYNGIDSIAYAISDGQGGTSNAHVAVTITPVNDAPTARPIAAQAGADAQPIALDVGGFFADVDGDALTYSATGLPPGLAIDPASGRIAGTLDHAASRGSVYHVVVTATDPSHASASSGFDWTIVNPAPVAADDRATTPQEVRVTIPVLANDADPDGDPLTVTGAVASHGSVAINPDGTIDYQPNTGFRGDDVIVYTIADGDGGQASASVLVTVLPVNHAPSVVAAPPAATALEGTGVSIAAAPWFADRDGDALAYAATGLPKGLSIDPASGAISGVVDHSAAAQAPGGRYTVVVSATDAGGLTASSTFTLDIANQAPIATDSAARTGEETGIVLPALANARDPDGDPLAVTAATAQHGAVTINPDGTLAYRPGASFSGVDTVRYTVTDSDGATATASVTVTVDHVNHPPVVPAQDAPVEAIGGRPVRIDALAGVTDADGDSPTIVQASSANGDVSVGSDGVISFTPQLGFVGTTTIRYVVADGQGGFTDGTFVVRVADGRGADINELLEIGRVRFVDPSPGFARVVVADDGVIRNPLTILDTVEQVRSLNTTAIGREPVGDAVEAARSLNGTGIDPDQPVTAEVAQLEVLRDQRDAGDRLFDHRWGDFLVKGATGFSAAADHHACIMVDSVVRGGALYIEVRDTAPDGAAAIRSVDVRPARGPMRDWIKVDPRGLAIVERAADADELHLVVRVTRADGRTSTTPIVVQGATGEIELDRTAPAKPHHHRAAPLDATLATRHAVARAAALRLDRHFK